MKRLLPVLVVVLLLLDAYLVGIIARNNFIENSHIPNRITVNRVADYAYPIPKKLPPLTKTISDPVTVQKLYNAALTLPPRPSLEHRLCLGYSGLEYRLSFFRENNLLMQTKIDFTGCGQFADLQIADKTYSRSFGDDFKTLLITSLGITTNEFFGAN